MEIHEEILKLEGGGGLLTAADLRKGISGKDLWKLSYLWKVFGRTYIYSRFQEGFLSIEDIYEPFHLLTTQENWRDLLSANKTIQKALYLQNTSVRIFYINPPKVFFFWEKLWWYLSRKKEDPKGLLSVKTRKRDILHVP